MRRRVKMKKTVGVVTNDGERDVGNMIETNDFFGGLCRINVVSYDLWQTYNSVH